MEVEACQDACGDEFSEDCHGWASLPYGDFRHLDGNELKVLGIVTWEQHFANQVDRFKARHNRDLRYTKGMAALTYDAGFGSWKTTKRVVLSLEAKGYFKVEQRDHAAWIIDVIHAPSYGVFNPEFSYPERAPREKGTDKPLLVDEHGEVLPRESPRQKCAGVTKTLEPCKKFVRLGDYCDAHWEQASPIPLMHSVNKHLMHSVNKHPEPPYAVDAQAVQIVQKVVVGSSGVEEVLKEHSVFADVQFSTRDQRDEITRLRDALRLKNPDLTALIAKVCGVEDVQRSADLTEPQAAALIADLQRAEHSFTKMSHLDGWGALAR